MQNTTSFISSFKNSLATFFGVLALIFTSYAHADPAPFGLEIGKTTISEMKKQYRATKTGVNKYTNGQMFSLNTAQLGFDGLKEATIIFDDKDKVSAILLSFPKQRFDTLHQSLRSKYHVVSSQIPFVGNKKVVMKNGKTEITLNAPHMSFDMDLNYISQSMMRKFEKMQALEAQKKRQSEQSKL